MADPKCTCDFCGEDVDKDDGGFISDPQQSAQNPDDVEYFFMCTECMEKAKEQQYGPH